MALRRRRPTLLAAPDSFKGTASAFAIAEAMAHGASLASWDCDACPLSDGGEGFAEVMSMHGDLRDGTWRSAAVSGPLGGAVEARWWWSPPDAVLEAAAASGLVLAGGRESNDPLRASTRGTGELIAAAVAGGASRVLVGVGGTASTDGGLGAVEALEEEGMTEGFEIVVACDVDIGFLDAAEKFGPQKGASPGQVTELRLRLEEAARLYLGRYGTDVTAMARAGAAGGLSGGLAAIGGRLVSGFDLVADHVQLRERIRHVRAVATGEGRLDPSSWSGKVVGGVLGLSRARGVPVLVVVGEQAPGTGYGSGGDAPQPTLGLGSPVEIVSLVERFGERARTEVAPATSDAVREALSGLTIK